MHNVVNEMTYFTTDGDKIPGYLAGPTGEGPFPGVVVVQEWWGLNDQIKRVADRLAQEQFVAFAPDLYRGQTTEEPDAARKLAMELDQGRALNEIQGAVDFLRAQPFVEPKKIGIMGFCMGGGLAAIMAFRGRNVGAVAVFYGGRGTPDEDVVKGMSAPFLGLYGEQDDSIPLDMVRGWESLMAAHGKPHEMVIYQDAGHAFFNDEQPSYRREAAEDAWRRTLEWFRRYLCD